MFVHGYRSYDGLDQSVCDRPAVVMTDGCLCHRVSPSLASFCLRVTSGLLQLSRHPLYIASWWHWPLIIPCPIPSHLSLSLLWLNIHSFSPPAGPPSLLSHQTTTTITSSDLLRSLLLFLLLSSFFPHPVSSFSPASAPTALTWLSLPSTFLIPCSVSACTCSTLSSHKIYHIPLLRSFILQQISHSIVVW